MKKKEKKLDVIFILDKSGSMSGSEENTISSFNEYLEREKKNKFNTSITTVLFSDKYSYLHNNIDIKSVKPITPKEYYVGGCTALYDTLGNTICDVEKRDTDKVLFIIITDGYENASNEYSNEKIKRLIKKHSDWQFIYIGADIDSYAAGSSIGIRRENIANYVKDKTGSKTLFRAVNNFECAMMEESTNDTNWKEELDNYIQSKRD